MQLSDFYPVIITVSLIVGAICALRIFFTLWGPIDRWMNRDRSAPMSKIQVRELEKKIVNIHLKSKTRIDGVVLLGHCASHQLTPFAFRQMIVAVSPGGLRTYIRSEEIEYMEQQAEGDVAGVSEGR